MKQFMQPNADEVAKLEQVSTTLEIFEIIVTYVAFSSSPKLSLATSRTRISPSRRLVSLTKQAFFLLNICSPCSFTSPVLSTTITRAMSIGPFGGHGTKVRSRIRKGSRKD